MSLLFEDKPLVINPKLAELIGLNEAIIIQQMSYWLKRSDNIIDGKRWVYNSAPKWKKQFPFFSESTIKRAIYKLEELGLLFTGNYNKDGRDKTKWYSINYKAVSQLMNDASCQNERWNDQIDTMERSNLTRPLPENTTEITTDIYSRDKSLDVDDENIDQPVDDLAEEIKTTPNQSKKIIPYQKIVDIYNDVCGDVLPRCLKLDKKRKANIQKCWNSEFNGAHPFKNLECWRGYFNDCLDNKFWCGENNRGWKADIEFVTRESSVLKILEGE